MVTVILKTESGDCPGNTDQPIQVNKNHVHECLEETLKQMYGASMVNLSEDALQLLVTIDDKQATIDLDTFVCSNERRTTTFILLLL